MLSLKKTFHYTYFALMVLRPQATHVDAVEYGHQKKINGETGDQTCELWSSWKTAT